jgi:glucose-6-phosphate isomerase
MKFPAHI